jgi:hypothetical protein
MEQSGCVVKSRIAMDSGELPAGGLGTRESLPVPMADLGRDAGEPLTPWHPLGGLRRDHHG